ncbi:MAG: hypothetical protein QM751_07415 [Paludibacteraceae bacterium]
MNKKILKTIAVIAILFTFSANTYSQLLAWQFATPTELTGKEESVEATTVDPGLEVSVLTRGPNAKAGPGNSRGFSGNFPIDETKADARRSGAYYQFVVTVKKGYTVSLSQLNAVLRRQENSAFNYRWMYSLDGRKFKEIGAEDNSITDLGNNGVKQPELDLKAYTDLQNLTDKTTVTFRLYAWGGNGEKAKRAFGFGKSNTKGSKVLWINGTSVKNEK